MPFTIIYYERAETRVSSWAFLIGFRQLFKVQVEYAIKLNLGKSQISICMSSYLFINRLYLYIYITLYLSIQSNMVLANCVCFYIIYISLSRPEKILIKFWPPPKMWFIYAKKLPMQNIFSVMQKLRPHKPCKIFNICKKTYFQCIFKAFV